MAERFVACDREQSFLMPPDVREWLPPRHLAWFVIGAVAEMDLEEFYASYRVDGRSRPPYDRAMMVALLLYAYARGIRSSRVIERACEEDGTKVHANASREENVDYEQLAREIVEEAKAVDAAEDELYGEARVDELPPEFETAQGRRGWLREAKQRVEAERAAVPAAGAAQPPQAPEAGQAPPARGALDRGARQPGLRDVPGARPDEGRPALRPARRTP